MTCFPFCSPHTFPSRLYPSKTEKRGSVLLLTLMVVSLLMIVVLAFVVMVRMELRSVINQQNLLQARANARFGLEMAIARLQEAAGPDTRITAPITQTPDTPPNHAWLYRGIDSAPVQTISGTLELNAEFGRNAGILLSHDPDEPFDASTYWPYPGGFRASEGHVLLVGENSVPNEDQDLGGGPDGVPDGIVAAPLLEIEDGTESTFAFWIQDMGTLARANLNEPTTNTAGVSLSDRERASTVHRIGAEALVEQFDVGNPTHVTQMAKLESTEQIDFADFAEADTSKELFHDMTLRSAGLPVNVTRGGFQRDLSAVLREMEANGGEVDSTGVQWNALQDYQADRIRFWKELTDTLPASPPASWMAGEPEWKRASQWNALTAITLRDEQADTAAFSEKLFPPHSDLDLRWDPGGPEWGQLLGYATIAQRLSDGNGNLITSGSRPDTMTAQPVIARFSISYYFTLDWPTLRIHFIPSVVLWNPYNKPIRPPSGREWQFIWAYEAQTYKGYGISFQVSHPDWRGGEKIWTPTYRMPWMYNGNNGQFLFRLNSGNGSDPVTLPPGEAVFFTMSEHVPVSLNLSTGNRDNKWHWRNLFVGYVPQNTIIDLVQGMNGDGGYSFYVEHEDMDDRLRNIVAKGPRRDPERWNQNSTWNEWDAAGLPFDVHQVETPPGSGIFVEVDGSRPPQGGYTEGSDYPVNYAVNRARTPAERAIAINNTGLDGWDFNAATTVISGRGGGSEFRPRGIRLGTVTNGQIGTWLRNENSGDVVLRFLYLATPTVLEEARPTDFDDPARPNILPFFASGLPSFTPTVPFNEADHDQFPAWGHVWGLRLPDSSFTYQQSAAGGDEAILGAHFGAPSRWLVDYNPTAPFQNPDPVGRMRDRQYRGSYQNPGAYIGGFTIDPSAFKLAQFNPEGTDNQFIGWSDDLPPAGAMASNGSLDPSWVPQFAIVDVPEGSEDIASLAAFSHTRFTNDRAYASQNVQTDYSANVPTYPIGNSLAPVLIPRDQASKSYWLLPGMTGPGESIPYSQSRRPNDYHVNDVSFYPGYDFSWMLNQVLWDDFLTTPDANTRLSWRKGQLGLEQEFGPLRRDFNQSAEQLEILGAFNVNSLSVRAWSALYHSTLGVQIDGTDGVDPSEEIPFTRFLEPLSEPYSTLDGDTFDHTRAYTGYRRLTSEEATRLAESTVEQVRQRGPFLSMSDFVNRALIPNEASLVSPEADPRPFALKGALQAAINQAGLNDSLGTDNDSYTNVNPSDLVVGDWRGSHRFHGMTVENFEGQKAIGAPGYLLASDILTRLGSVLRVRSDTFRIRSYGSLGGEGTRMAEVWVEAVVQRRPDWVDSSNPPDATAEELSALNQLFGRQFEIVSFRYLGRDDI